MSLSRGKPRRALYIRWVCRFFHQKVEPWNIRMWLALRQADKKVGPGRMPYLDTETFRWGWRTVFWRFTGWVERMGLRAWHSYSNIQQPIGWCHLYWSEFVKENCICNWSRCPYSFRAVKHVEWTVGVPFPVSRIVSRYQKSYLAWWTRNYIRWCKHWYLYLQTQLIWNTRRLVWQRLVIAKVNCKA